jgi:CheY-like chemotaxis protein
MMQTTQQHILVAEDNSALACVIKFNLLRAGYQVTIADDGLQAWEYVQANRFDLIITDQQMPEMTGCELCEKLRSMPEYADLPVIMLTAKGLELELPRLRDELKIMATFMKPFSPKEVLKAVEDCLAATH